MWQDLRLDISLDQALLTCLEDQARWVLAKNGQPGDGIPNLFDFVYMDALDAVAPERITVFR